MELNRTDNENDNCFSKKLYNKSKTFICLRVKFLQVFTLWIIQFNQSTLGIFVKVTMATVHVVGYGGGISLLHLSDTVLLKWNEMTLFISLYVYLYHLSFCNSATWDLNTYISKEGGRGFIEEQVELMVIPRMPTAVIAGLKPQPSA